MPKEPLMLLSYINTQLRDCYPDFQSLCNDKGADAEMIVQKLRSIDYEYDANLNRFV